MRVGLRSAAEATTRTAVGPSRALPSPSTQVPYFLLGIFFFRQISDTPPAAMASAGAQADMDAPLMVGNVIDGKAVAARIRVELSAQVAVLKRDYGRVSRCRTSPH